MGYMKNLKNGKLTRIVTMYHLSTSLSVSVTKKNLVVQKLYQTRKQ